MPAKFGEKKMQKKCRTWNSILLASEGKTKMRHICIIKHILAQKGFKFSNEEIALIDDTKNNIEELKSDNIRGVYIEDRMGFKIKYWNSSF